MLNWAEISSSSTDHSSPANENVQCPSRASPDAPEFAPPSVTPLAGVPPPFEGPPSPGDPPPLPLLLPGICSCWHDDEDDREPDGGFDEDLTNR